MTVALVHYHLHRGGVRTVLEAQSRALQAAGVQHVVLSGTAPAAGCSLPVVHLPALNYAARDDTPDTRDLLASLDHAAERALGGSPDLWHFHNHSLGKNYAVSEIPSLLAERGTRVVLQIHDFAEDGRPGNFECLDGCETLYPVAGHVHYTFINSRDCSFLTTSGLPVSNCHLLPNAVNPPARPGIEPLEQEGATVLYPVRGIRRKNLGELCLLSALAPAGTRFAVSLAPDNPQWRPNFEQWKEFAASHQLPVTLGVVGHHEPAPGVSPTFENWLAYSTHLATTSIAEGFGLSFLEPVGLGLPLLGRDLPEITRDFKDCGINLGSLYERLAVPLAWIDEAGLKESLRQRLSSSYASYRRQASEETIARAWDSLIRDDTVDFGNLPEGFQMKVIEKALGSPESLETKAWLEAALNRNRAESPVEAIAPFSPAAYQLNLSNLHRTVAGAPVTEVSYHSRDSVLDQFLKPERFHFLRT